MKFKFYILFTIGVNRWIILICSVLISQSLYSVKEFTPVSLNIKRYFFETAGKQKIYI